MNVTIQKNGLKKTLPLGFSLSYFFLAAWLPFFKGQIGKSFKHSILTVVTLSIYYWIQAFGGWNRSVLEGFIEKGWAPLTELDEKKMNF